jgi:hypothetical protein
MKNEERRNLVLRPILHSSFCLLHSPRGGFVGALWALWGGYGVAISCLSKGLAVDLMSHEMASLGLSSFCLLPSAFALAWLWAALPRGWTEANKGNKDMGLAGTGQRASTVQQPASDTPEPVSVPGDSSFSSLPPVSSLNCAGLAVSMQKRTTDGHR